MSACGSVHETKTTPNHVVSFFTYQFLFFQEHKYLSVLHAEKKIQYIYCSICMHVYSVCLCLCKGLELYLIIYVGI